MKGSFVKTRDLPKVLFAFVASILCTLCCVVLVGCSSPSPTEVTTQFLEGVKANDSDAMQEDYSGDSSTLFKMDKEEASDSGNEALSEDNQATMESVINTNLIPKLREFDYELSNETIDGDKATVDAKITTYAAGEAFNSFASDYMSQAFASAFSGASEEDLASLGVSIFDSKIKSMSKTYTDTVTFTLTKTDGNWKVDAIDPEGDIADAFLGGLITSVNAMDTTYRDL